MDTLYDYQAWKAKRQESDVGAAQVVLGSVNEKPDEAAGDLNLANEYGKVTGNPTPPAPLVKEYRNVFQQKIEEARNNTILSGAPILTQWLRNPENATVAKDDLQNLSWFEGFGRGAGNTLARAGLGLGQIYDQYMLNQTAGRYQDRQKTFGELLDSERDTVSTSKGDVRMLPNLGDFIGAAGRYLDARYADLIGTDDAENAKQYADALQQTMDRIRAHPKSEIATEAETSMFQDGATIGQTLQNIGGTIIKNPAGVLSWALETAGESLPQLGAALGVTAATRNPVAGIATLGFGSYASERYRAVPDFLAEKGVDLSKPEGVQRILSDPDLLREANDKGVIRGLIVGAFDAASAGLAGVPLAHNPIVEAFAQSAQQGISGMLGEYFARKASGQPVDWGEIFAEGMAQIATTPVDLGIAGRKLLKDRARAKAAEATAAQIGEVSAQSQASALRNRIPDKFRQFVEAATKNGPTENVYVPADQFAQYFQGIGVDPHSVVDQLEGVTRDDLDAAIAGGGDLKIPTATYAAKIAGTEHDPFLMENMRFDPDEFTSREAAEFNAKAEDAMQSTWEEAERIRLHHEELRSFEQEIYDTMVSRLRAAGRSTDVATTEATLYPAFYRVMAERSGMTVEDFMRSYPLPKVEGELPEGMQLKNVDALTRTLAEARAQRSAGLEKRGPTLLEFIDQHGGINDVGGELRAMDAETVKRGKGKKTLRLARGGMSGIRDMFGGAGGKKHGIDDVAQAAIEAGYMADDPVANEYREAVRQGRQVPDIGRALLAAVDRELRGTPEYSGHAQPSANADLDQIEAYLHSIGTSLDESDEAIRKAVETDQAGREYGQSAPASLSDVEVAAERSGVDLAVSERGGLIVLSKIIASDKGRGAGTRVMNALIAYADAHGKSIALTPSTDFGGTSVARLRDFYKRFGFVDNKGRNKDFSTREAMIRPSRNLLFQSGGPGPRGSIQFPAAGVGNGDTVVRLFQSADLSTMVHESGHYFLTVLQDLAGRGETSVMADFDAVKGWWRENAGDVAKDGRRVMPDVDISADDVISALENGTTGDVMKDAAIDVGMQEQFARGFEAYLMEGKAPNAELRTAFEKFRAWLVSVYQKLSGLNVQISDDIRKVFDRLLATDEEIDKAKSETGGENPLFPDAESMGLTQEEYDNFLKLRSQAEDEAKARLLGEIMAPVKRAQEKWFKDERAKVRDEIERQVNAYPYFRALEWMGNRRWFGDDQPENMPDMRLSKKMLVDRYGEGVLKTLPRGKQTVYTVDGGLDPDDAAGWFGFDSGDQMITALEKAPPRKEAIEAETDRIMRERHGDPLNDGSIEADALDAIHTDKRGQWIAAELKAVTDVIGTGGALTAKEARASARRTIARMRVRDAISAGRFLAAERKAANEAAKLGAILAREGVWMNAARRKIATKARGVIRGEGTADAVASQIEQSNRSTGNYNETVADLIQAKRRQLTNHALYMEARKVADEVEKAERYIDRLTKTSTRERIAGAGRRENAGFDYLGAIDEILERYDFRRLSGTAEQRRGALNSFVEGMRAAGRENELAIPDSVLAEAARKPYKTLPVEELRGVIDSLKNLEHVATRWNKLIDAQRQRDLDAAVDEVAAAFDANVKKRPPGRVGSKGEAARNAFRQFLDLGLNAGTLLREIDGFGDLGAAYRNIKSPIDDAMNRLIVRKEKAANDLENLYAVYSKEERRRMGVREHMPELGYALSKWEKIAVALNTGNAGNFQRLTDPRIRGSLTEDQVRAVLATLDERDAKFVQSIWNYLETFRDDIAARERRATGVEPAWVEPQSVDIGGKTLKGGYYPLRYDARLSSLVRDDEAALSAQSIQSGRFGKAQTRNGHLKERGQASGRAVELDMSVLHRHVNQVIYDLELSEPVANGWRVLQNGRIRSAFIEAGKQPDFEALETWLQDVGNGELRSADLVGRAARIMKSNFTAAKLAFNLVTVATQVAGLAQTMVVVGKKDFVRGLKSSFRPGLADEIAAKSPFMASRQTTFNKDIYDFYSDPKTGPIASRWGDIKRHVIGPLSFWMMTKVQWHLADIPTWMAGYQQGLRKFGNDEAKAIAHADDIVKRAQASGLFADRSAIERGSVSRTTRQNDVIRLFTALGSYMFAKFNVAYERTTIAGRVIGDEGLSARSAQEALSYTIDMAFLFTLEAVILGAIKGELPGQGGGDDGDDDSWTKFLARETAYSALGTLPFVRDGVGAYQGFTAGGTYGGVINDAVRGAKGATDLISAPFMQDGEVKASDVKAVINATGLAIGLPATQINRAVDAAWRQSDGQDVSPLEYLMGKKSR